MTNPDKLIPFVDYLTEDQGNWERQNDLHIGPEGEDLPFGTISANQPPGGYAAAMEA